MTAELRTLAGTPLGRREVVCDERTAIIYAICCGASPEQLDLVWEEQLRPLPGLATALGLWAVEAAGDLGAYDRRRSLHVGQSLAMRRPLEPGERVPMEGRVSAVYDKGKSALVEIDVEAEAFAATYAILLPGLGGFGGDRGPAAEVAEPFEADTELAVTTARELALLYRLTGDRHPIHVDPATAQANGFEKPILHGLCTLGLAAVAVAEHTGAHPADLVSLCGRFAAPVTPGDTVTIAVASSPTGGAARRFEASVGEAVVIRDGIASFA